MVELAEAYRLCRAAAPGAAPRAPRRTPKATRVAAALPSAGAAAVDLLDRALATAAPREAVQTLMQVADAWPGTVEGDRARVLLVTSDAARNSLSARERAGHLVLVVDETSRDAAWDGFSGRDELAVAQVVYNHPTAPPDLHGQARARLAALDDWATLCADPDDDVRRAAVAHLLLREGATLLERAGWLPRRERNGFDAAVARWCDRVRATRAEALSTGLRDALDDAERSLLNAWGPARAGRG